MNSSKTSATQFANAVFSFFGHNPSNPYWALVALTMRKLSHLEIVENLPEDDGVLVLDEITPYFAQKGSVREMHVVCRPKDVDKIREILDTFRGYEAHDNGTSILTRNQWERSILLNFASELIKLDEEWFQSNFESCFNFLVHRIFATGRFDEFSQPIQLSELVGYISNSIAPDAKVVYNPFSGMSSYALYMPKNAYYIGEERLSLIAAIANLRLFAESIQGEVRIADAVMSGNLRADLIVSTPPFGVRIQPESVHFAIDRVMTTEEFILHKSLSQSVPAIIVVPRGFNYRKNSSERLRQDLVESGELDMVINLPEKIFTNTAIGTSIYVLNPDHNHQGSVRFIDGTRSYIEQSRTRVLDVESVVNIIDNGRTKSKLVTVEDLKKNDYNLSPERYFSDDIQVPEGMKLMKMSELGEIFKQSCNTLPAEGKFVNFGALKNQNPIKVYSADDFEETELPNRRSLNLVHSGLLFFGGRGNLGICISSEGEPLFTYPDYINFVPDDEVVLPQYVIMQFNEEYVKEQLIGIQSGRMPNDVFQNIRILVPSIEIQRKSIEDYQGRLIADLGLEVNNLKTHQANEFERNMHLRKHALKQVLNEVVPASRRIANFISSQDGDFNKKSVVAQRSQATLEDYAQKLFRNMEKIQSLISALTDDEKYPEAITFDFHYFLADYRHNKITEDKFTFSFIGESHFLDEEPELPEIPEDGSQVYIASTTLTVRIAPAQMVTVLDNIIANAVNHGFTDPSRKDYNVHVKFRNILSDEKEMLEISILNNGNKLPSGVTPEKVFTWGVGSGTGLGSWQAKNIIEHYGGSIELLQHDDAPDGFIVEYRIVLPMN